MKELMEEMEPKQLHFLVVTFPFQGHINPALHLAKHLAHTAPRALVTFSTTLSAHRRMFPSSPDSHSDALLSYAPFSDGFDDGDTGGDARFNQYMKELKLSGSRNLSLIISDLAARGRAPTCIVYTMLLPWVADVASDHQIPSVHYWIQPATVFAIYYHYFHDHSAVIDAHRDDPSFAVTLPGLPPLKIRDIPSFLTTPPDHPLYAVYLAFRDCFAVLDREAAAGSRPRVLVNTFDSLEPDALASVPDVELLTIGPVLPSFSNAGFKESGGDIFKPDDEKRYVAWLDEQPARSVVYVSFGSLRHFSRQEMEELAAGLAATSRPYLWVVRRDNKEEERAGLVLRGKGMVVEWCSQIKVLSHEAVGCFVTHCGWNSTLESLACGVPTVGVPRLSDQTTTARMAEAVWGTGVTVEIGREGVVEAEELRRCVEVVMGKGERGKEIRARVAEWKERVIAVVAEGGSSDRNLRAFLEGFREHGHRCAT